MTGVMLRKELRQLLPVAVVFGALELVGILETLVVRAPEDVSWADLGLVLRPDLSSAVALMLLTFAFVAAYMQLPREFEQRTVEFLFALPVTRTRVFFTKFLAVCILGVSIALADGVINWWLQLFASGSFVQDQFRLSLAALEVGLLSAYFIVCAAYGMLLSFWRRLALPIVFAIWIVLTVIEQVWPWLAPLNVMNLLHLEHVGREPRVAWGAWAGHVLGASVALGLAAWLWLEHRSWAERRSPRRDWGPVLNGAYWVSLVGGVLVALGVAAFVASREGAQDTGATDTQTLQTEHFVFEYPTAAREPAMLVMREADTAYVRVSEMLGVERAGRVVADLTEQSEMHAGIAGWKKVRINVGSEDPGWLKHVLYHEVAHVMAAAATNTRISEHHHATFLFSEGLAEYVASSLLKSEREDPTWLPLAGTAVTRLDITFDDLVDQSRFLARYDPNLVYPVGHSWVVALVRACGEQAPQRVLRSMRREDLPQRLSGRDFWEQVMLGARCSLEVVNARWLSAMQRAARAAKIPTPVGVFVGKGERAQFEVDLEGARPDATYSVGLRVRDNPRSSLAQTAHARGRWQGEAVVLEVDARVVAGERFQFQVGVVPLAGGRPFFGRWQQAGGVGED